MYFVCFLKKRVHAFLSRALSLLLCTFVPSLVTKEKLKKKTDSQNPEDGVGEISVQIDLFTHPGTGEHKVTVKGK